jgi:hypothetical protein
MWMPTGLVYTAAALRSIALWLVEPTARGRRGRPDCDRRHLDRGGLGGCSWERGAGSSR